MIELFLNLSERSVGTLHVGQWNYIQKGLQRNVQKIQQFYRINNPTVRSDHFLIRLLESIAVPRSLELERYYGSVDRIALAHGQALGMTSPISEGKVFRGIFYGANTPEYLIASDDYFDFYETDRNWQNAVAITPLMHAKSDLTCQLLNGKPYSAEQGLTVIQINIPMLAVQWRAFMNAEKIRSPNPRTIGMFLGTYVIPNMMQAHLDLAIFNRIYRDATSPDSDSNEPYRNHPFGLPKYDFMVDDALERALENIDRSSLDFQTVLKTIPAVFKDSQWQALKMPDIVPTRQVDWLLVATRLKVIDFLFKVCKRDLLPKNQIKVNQILKALRHNDIASHLTLNVASGVASEMNHYVDTVQVGAERDFFN